LVIWLCDKILLEKVLEPESGIFPDFVMCLDIQEQLPICPC
jgi:hypothetical protein